MKKFNAILGTLALTGSLLAQADTSTTTTAATAPSIADKMIFKYYGTYSGPSIGNPNEFTIDGGSMTAGEVQYIDSIFTLGYKINDKLNFLANYRFMLRPIFMMTNEVEGAAAPFIYRNRDPWLSLQAPKLLTAGNLNVAAEIRGYIPATTHKKIMGAIRLNQTTTYDVPKTRLTLGVYTIQLANMLTDVGSAGEKENIFLDVSPFANYQLTPTLAATFWTDVIQATYATVGGKSLPQGWANAAIPMYVGVGWDVTPNVNLNPQLTIYPATATLNSTVVGAILSAKLL
jgi:hypothetical protein